MSSLGPGRLDGRVALVTGAARGIGRAIAQRLAREGARTVVADVDAGGLDETAGKIAADGAEALAVAADLRDPASVEDLFSRLDDAYGHIDILVNNAARVYDTTAHFLDVDVELWDGVVAANLRTMYLCTARAAKRMADARAGTIVNVSAASGTRAHRMLVPYDTTKGGVDAFTRAVALDLAPFGIRVNAVAPGAIRVEAWGELGEDEIARRAGTVPLGRLGSAEDIAAVVAFVCSADAGYITGQTIAVDGGLLAQLRSPEAEIWEPGARWPG